MIRLVKQDKSVLGKANNTRWEYVIKEFINSGNAICEITYSPEEYANPKSLHTTAFCAIRKLSYPVNVVIRKGKVYLVRTDM
jgi:hypothetical protein